MLLVEAGVIVAQIRAGELDVFLKGGGALDINSVRKKPRVRRPTKGLAPVRLLWCMVTLPHG